MQTPFKVIRLYYCILTIIYLPCFISKVRLSLCLVLLWEFVYFLKAVWKYFFDAYCKESAMSERENTRMHKMLCTVYTKETFEIFLYEPSLMNKLEWLRWVRFRFSVLLCIAAPLSKKKKKKSPTEKYLML